MNFDPLNILLLAVALVVFWRLRSVLGTRTGTEKPPFDPFGAKRTESPVRQDGRDNVVRLPQGAPASGADSDQEPAPPVWQGYAEAGSPLALGLEQVAENDPSFSPRSFLEGAKVAYEMIIDGFAKGDKASLKNLLSKEVLDGFAQAIDAREAQGQRVESRFVGIDKATLHAATLMGSKAAVTVEFVSELISATYDRSDKVIDGDPKQIREVTDVWTFERDITSRNPNWKLVSTQAPD
ncbi:MAG: Tim44/TimA family putative adaptor protein [Aestuariivirga sp.]|uniref:Tim44/TimA family putative adaptor protein n=1 Tax=Aestuariivirga sp. TaxID=2650926 RepID=UPI0038D1C092